MDFEDKHIKDILSNASLKEVSVPAWSKMSGSVRKQNFLTFGLTHFNIYLLSILLVFLFFGLCTFINFNKDVTIETQNTNQYKHQTPLNNTTNTIFIDADTSVLIEQDDNINNIQHTEKQNVNAHVKSTKKVEKVKVDNVKHIENTNINESIETSQQSAPELETKEVEKPKGKTIIVYETDTVINYDTLFLDKKKKRRKSAK